MIKLEGLVSGDDMRTLAIQFHDEWAGQETSFVLVVDARTFVYFTADAQALFEELLEGALDSGLIRVSVLAISTGLANLFCSIMVDTDAMPIYQYLDLSYEKDFRSEMDNWLNEPFQESSPTS